MINKPLPVYSCFQEQGTTTRFSKGIYFIILGFLLYLPQLLCAQQKVAFLDSLADKMSWYSQRKSTATLFVHLDKNIYTPFENIWFKAYLVKSSIAIEQHTILSVALVSSEGRKVWMQEKFLVHQGLSSGNLLLPDSLPAGQYHFIAYTNIQANDLPVALFTQTLIVRVAEASHSYNATFDSSRPDHRKPQVRFYPEGGHLVDGLSSRVGWEIKDAGGGAFGTSAVLYENNTALDTIKTNNYGFGQFTLIPKEGKRYQVKLLNTTASDTLYLLPPSLAAGTALRLLNALASDTLNVQIRNTKQEQTLYVILHNYEQIFHAFTLRSAPTGTMLALPLAKVPKGLTTLTILDFEGRPLAERLFFAHYNKRIGVEITTDSTSYTTRSKVQLNLKLTDEYNQPAQGTLSLACVQKKRLEPSLFQDIKSYTYLRQDIEQPSFASDALENNKQSRSYLEDVLLIKGWSKYNWPDLIESKPNDTLIMQKSLLLQGQLTQNGKNIKKQVEVYIMSDSLLQVVRTDAKGYFELTAENLMAPKGSNLSLFLNKKYQQSFQIKVQDPFPQMNARVATQLKWQPAAAAHPEHKDSFYALNTDSKYTNLKTVVVRATKAADKQFYDREFYVHPFNKIYEGKCTDYVCAFNVLNCPNHPAGERPIQGEVYMVLSSWAGPQQMVYHDNCKPPADTMNVLYYLRGLRQEKEWYGLDYTVLNATTPQYQTTLFWNASVTVNSRGKASLSFYTDDVPGTFEVIVQGGTQNDVFSATAQFKVHE